MKEFEALLGLLLVAVVLAAVARKVGAPYPAFLALGGAVLAFVPGAPALTGDAAFHQVEEELDRIEMGSGRT